LTDVGLLGHTRGVDAERAALLARRRATRRECRIAMTRSSKAREAAALAATECQ
jgi:hypothetical protein